MSRAVSHRGTSVVVHGHFYQPPREDPWRDEVVPEPTAAPHADWNARILAECYAPFTAARVLDATGRVARTLNLFEWTSFDLAPTLARWIERKAPAVHAAIVAADHASARRLGGHGNAIATPLHHVILPLASRRDKVTEVRWGLADFRRRFGRDAEGFWLPETAVDEETLVVLAEEGVRFTIVAPHQVEHPPADGSPLRFAAGGGREVAIFAYDAVASSQAAFGSLLEDGDHLADRLAPRRGRGHKSGAVRLSSFAVDGETFGHHRKFAEMALARAVTRLRSRRDAKVENFAAFLARTPATQRAIVVSPSSWSCEHGVERWRSGCSCGLDAKASHAWRRPLRSAFDWLARELDHRFVRRGAGLCPDPWGARDGYAAMAALPRETRRARVARRHRTARDAAKAFALLDGARARLGMFGSCAWFFDLATGYETTLMLRLAAYAIDQLGDAALEAEFMARLALARDGGVAGRSAADSYRTLVMPLRPVRRA